MKIILVKAFAGTLYSGTNELSWEKKKAPLHCWNCFCSGTFCGLEMLKSQPSVIVPAQQKLLQLLQTCLGRAAALGVALGDKMPQGRVARAGGIPGVPRGSDLPSWDASSCGCWLVQAGGLC